MTFDLEDFEAARRPVLLWSKEGGYQFAAYDYSTKQYELRDPNPPCTKYKIIALEKER